MSGTHKQLTDFCSLAVDVAQREDFSLLTSAILESQYVRQASCQKTFKVLSGAGMGMAASGHIADSVFYFMAEKDFILEQTTRDSYGLVFYARFKDDIFLIFDTPEDSLYGIRRFVENFKRRSGPFLIQIDSISKHGCQMLDLFVSSGCSTPKFSLFKKESSIWRPLSLESCHTPTVHVHWPINQCMRVRERFSDSTAAGIAVEDFRRAYQLEMGGVDICEMKRPRDKLVELCSWLVLPYDFIIGPSRVQQVLNRIKVPSGALKRVRISWSLANKHLMHLLRPKY